MTCPPRLSVEQLRDILARRQAAVRAAGDNLRAMWALVYKQVGTDWREDKAVEAEFQALLREVPPEVAEKLVALNRLGNVAMDWRLLLAEWRHELDAVEAAGADALLDAGCDDEGLIAHCRSPRPHVRGCWAVDTILDKS